MKITPAGEIYDFFKDMYSHIKTNTKTKNREVNFEKLNNMARVTGLTIRFTTLGFMAGLALECLGVVEPGSVSGQANTYVGEPLKTLTAEFGSLLFVYLPGCGLSHLVYKQPESYKNTLSNLAEQMNRDISYVKRKAGSLADRIIKAGKHEE